MKWPCWQARYAKPLVLAALTLVAYWAAISRTQTLPWALAALLGATLIIGVAWPHWLVKRLSVRRTGPQRAQEGDTIVFHVELENLGWLPRFMVELVDRLPFVGAATHTPNQREKTLGVVGYVASGSTQRFEVPLVCEKRGFYQLGPVGLSSSFPLGLAEARQQRNDGVQTLTIYPDVFPIIALPLRGATSQIHRGDYLLPEGAGAAEFSGLREYRRGDNPRHVHWRTTARRNELMIKEFEPLASACLCIALDQAADSEVGEGRHTSFEYAVRIAASIANHAGGKQIPVRLMGRGEHALSVRAGTGERHYQTILDNLAVLDADGATPYASVLEQVAEECQHGETVVVFVSEPDARLPNTLNALAAIRARGANLFAVVFERETFLPSQMVSDSEPTHLTPASMRIAVAGLLELGAHCLSIRCGDNLVERFNL